MAEEKEKTIPEGDTLAADSKGSGVKRSEETEEHFTLPEVLPVLPLINAVVYPFMVLPLFVERQSAIAAIDAALAGDRIVLLVAEKDTEEGAAESTDLYGIGTAAAIMKMLKLPDGRTRVIVQGLTRARVAERLQIQPYISARVEKLEDIGVDEDDAEVEAWMRELRESLSRAASLGKTIPPELLMIANNIEEPGRLADLAATTLEIELEDAQRILEELAPVERLKLVHKLYGNELQVLSVKQRIVTHAQDEMEKSQRDYVLRQQLKAIQEELGETDSREDEFRELAENIKKAKMPAAALEESERQLEKLKHMHPDAAEAAVIRNYIDVMCAVPWSKSSRDRLDLKKAKTILDEDHFDLEKVKDRILEHLGVLKLKRNRMKGPILCFVGPPGVGKTSLGQSIARALGRKFIRLSLGGVRDEAEIRGHRRTYVGAMPGRIVQGISQAGTNNPVFMMDEVDKIGADFRGDPSSALLEVLDPEQNNSFRDNYLGVDFDLSRVMFILTANQLDTIQPAFLDRMEIIRLPGYTMEEKLQIARRYLVPRQRKANGITANQLEMTDEAIRGIVKSYTIEAGVRNLEREIASICRKVARGVAEGRKGKVSVGAEDLQGYLGPQKFLPDEMLAKDEVGVATGLAWTPAGGDVLFVEASVMKGGGALSLTGQLGDVMKESARAALSWARTNAAQLGLTKFDFGKHDIHVHVPEGSIPKDGPSAGVTMATALISAFTGKPIRKEIAMTGEITLRGSVLPVGGIKEKVLAARRMGIRKIILPARNEKDLVEIQEELRKDITFVMANSIEEVLKQALVEKKRKSASRKPARR